MLESELIINPDGSIYHLALRPEEIGDTVFLVGDQNRVKRVSRHFDEIELTRAKREFVTHTGRLGKQRLSVVSTGIGTDNIDIVVNELDALVNVDFQAREVLPEKRSLNLIRLGTSGGFDENLEVDSVVLSAFAIGLDAMPEYYHWEGLEKMMLLRDLDKEVPESLRTAYLVSSSADLLGVFNGYGTTGITLTCAGFYGPQGRELRLRSKLVPAIPYLRNFQHRGFVIKNLEMESSALFFLSRMLGHHTFSISTILANRARGTYSSDPLKAVDEMIEGVLTRIAAPE